jgi:hypothetical protein
MEEDEIAAPFSGSSPSGMDGVDAGNGRHGFALERLSQNRCEERFT